MATYIKFPVKIRTPDYFRNYLTPECVWISVSKTGRRERSFVNFQSNGKYNLVEKDIFPSIKINDKLLAPSYQCVNRCPYWGNDYGAIYYSNTWGWIYCTSGNIGVEPYEKKGDGAVEDEYVEDSFYTINDDDIGIKPDGEKFSLTGRGVNKDKTAEGVYVFPHWECKSQFGEYEPVGGVNGNICLGIPQWRDGKYKYYIRSLIPQGDYYSYGDIHYQNGKWIIGTEGNVNGWWEGSEPNKKNNVTFRFCKPEDSTAKGDDITISFYNYICGDNTGEGLLGEVAIWR